MADLGGELKKMRPDASLSAFCLGYTGATRNAATLCQTDQNASGVSWFLPRQVPDSANR